MSVLQLSALVSLFRIRHCLDRRLPGPDTGAQPLFSEDGKQILAVNGEIYNHIKLRAACDPGYKFKTHSDCEVIIPLVRRVYPYDPYELNNLLSVSEIRQGSLPFTRRDLFFCAARRVSRPSKDHSCP
jgi:Glutamine amidotransferase domain